MFRGSHTVAAGLLSPRQLQSSVWTRILRDVYADARLPGTPARSIAGARLVMPPTAVVAGRSAAYLYGARDIIEAHEPVEVLVPTGHRFGPVSGLSIRSVQHLPPGDVTGVGLTTPYRTLADLAVWAPNVEESVLRLDQLLHARRPPDSWRLDVSARVRGSAQARQAVWLADGRAESPPESRLRTRLVLAGLPPPEPQFVVRHAGRFVARVDLAYPDHALAIEYDGAWHAETGQFAGDRRRLNRLLAAGWRVVHVTAADMADLATVIAAIHAGGVR